MSSSSVDSDSGVEDSELRAATDIADRRTTPPSKTENGGPAASRIVELLQEEREGRLTPERVGNGSSRYHAVQMDSQSEDGSQDAVPQRAGSPIDSLHSIPDDSPSVQGSVLSSPGSSVLPSLASRPGLQSPTPSFRPFDRRFQSRLSDSTLSVPRASSPAFLKAHSRNVSLSSQTLGDSGDADATSPPWEVIRWTKLKKINGQAFSEIGRRNFGVPTCISVSTSIVLGTSKGIILIFDYHQNLKSIVGPGTKAVECGAVTSVAISADHLVIAGGHANGSIFTWEVAKVALPFLHIPSLTVDQMADRKADGHIPSVAIRHLGFLGTRHTALVSADDRGMAFSHLATRGLGSVARSVRTTRILGRYPDDNIVAGKPRKPSTVLAFSPLPLGNVERGTDTLGLTAMLTPYLLVIVSTTPVAQTQHKAARPKEVAAHSALSGCLAWFPSVRLKVKDPKTGSDESKVKLVYCWSNVLTVLEIDEEQPDKDKPPTLHFKPCSRWKAEEAIVAVQWLSRSVLAVLTITQRLIILEDGSMRMTEAFDLVHKHIYHQDLFSKQLHDLVEKLDEDDPSMHGVVADAFYMGFKSYKSRMFLLGFNHISVGTLSNWADRLVALMEAGDFIGAIHLSTSYYTGAADKLTIGLPEDTTLRHSMVQDKLVEIMTASLKYAFNQRRQEPQTTSDAQLKALAEACFEACLSMEDHDFLFDEAYEWYESCDVEGIFFEVLEPYILKKRLVTVPPTVVKSMVTYFVSEGYESRLEELICHMETTTLDIDEVTTLCKQHNLYDALIYVWNQACHDFITPLIDLLDLLVPLIHNGDYFSNGNIMEDPIFGVNALKMFPYMSYTFTGRVYPTGENLAEQDALRAKVELYWFLFSGKTITWPKVTGKPFLTQPSQPQEPSFPYLRMILKFDAPSFLSALNEAFEDSFLNGTPDRAVNGESDQNLSEEHAFGVSIDRQHILFILLDVMNPDDFAIEDTIYLNMFIARNLSKFSQYLLLPERALHKVLTGLCNYPGDDLADDAQLSVEYLLSIYHPPDIDSLIDSFRKAGFYRVLKSIYRSEKLYSKLLQTHFEGPDDESAVFDCIADCLSPRQALTRRQIRDVNTVIESHAGDLLNMDVKRTAQTIGKYAPSLHRTFLDTMAQQDGIRYIYLRTIIESEATETHEISEQSESSRGGFIEEYVQLMCKHEPARVAPYVEHLQASDLKLDRILPYMEASDVVDAAVILMARDGQIREGMDRLLRHLGKLESAFSGIVNSPTSSQTIGSSDDLLEALQKYVEVGIWLCQNQSHGTRRGSLKSSSRSKAPHESELLPDELLWLDLIDTTVQITQRLSADLSEVKDMPVGLDRANLVAQIRKLVQRSFTALLLSTSQPTTPTPTTANLSFLKILRAFLTRASVFSPNLSDLRGVLASIFSAYAYEERILSLSNRLLDKDLFVNVDSATSLRQRGWRPRGSTCEGCGRRVWGPGVSGDILPRWEEREAQEVKRRTARRSELSGGRIERGKGRAHARETSKSSLLEAQVDKGKATMRSQEEAAGQAKDASSVGRGRAQHELGPLIVLACRHIYHQACLEAVQKEETPGAGETEYRCPIDS